MAIDQQTRSEILRLRRAEVSTALAAIATVIAAFIVDLRRREGIPEESTRFHGYIARHFLIWLEHAGIDLKTVDGEVIGRFLRHDCHCAAFCAPLRVWRWRKRRTSPELMRFIRHLERTGQIETPGELDDNLRLLDVFLAGLRDEGHTEETVKSYRRSCTGLVVWLHLSRIRLCDLTPEVHARFRERRFACSIPGVFRGRQSQKPGADREGERRRFLDYLAETGRIAPLEPTPRKRAQPVRLAGFAVWLERHRGISRKTIRRHVRRIEVMLPELGDDPGTYDAALIRRVLLERMQPWSRGHARSLTSTMRMYLRFLASEGAIPGALVAAAPSVPQYQLSTLPRYIPPEDIERVIAGCGDDPMGVRDRAILLPPALPFSRPARRSLRVPACMVTEPPNGGPSTRSASNHVVTSMIRRGRYQPERQVLSGLRTRKENAPFHGALMISGYPSRLYDEHLCDWRSISLQVNNQSCVVTEKLWFNFAPGRVHWHSYAGRNFTDRQRIKRKAANWARNYGAMPPAERLAVLAGIMAAEAEG